MHSIMNEIRNTHSKIHKQFAIYSHRTITKHLEKKKSSHPNTVWLLWEAVHVQSQRR
jgi:hypothetical protein